MVMSRMLPLECMGPIDQSKPPRFFFHMPRVVPNQKNRFESDDLFKKLSRESEVRYTGYHDRPIEERRARFQAGCRDGHAEIAFLGTGINLQLFFGPLSNGYTGTDPTHPPPDFESQPGKVHLISHFILNGVCVRWRGVVDLDRLDGTGCLEFDEPTAQLEEALLKEEIQQYNQRMQSFEERFHPGLIEQDRFGEQS
ncbi:unnamed protein product [Darwinula stevensoni]|uniref:Core-binding factor subunit beta n=1 Tax=Darwinula stevensoni TaxID=69355 RepID=A0A7R8WYT6_9CRUS|nr:unnamed protein product [Darwinula stevensoni]CAG0879758.1 unnamed protein product [Darwinula stevensoni]